MSTEINPLMVNLGAQLSRWPKGTLGQAQGSFPSAQESAKKSHPQVLVAAGLLLFYMLKIFLGIKQMGIIGTRSSLRGGHLSNSSVGPGKAGRGGNQSRKEEQTPSLGTSALGQADSSALQKSSRQSPQTGNRKSGKVWVGRIWRQEELRVCWVLLEATRQNVESGRTLALGIATDTWGSNAGKEQAKDRLFGWLNKPTTSQ